MYEVDEETKELKLTEEQPDTGTAALQSLEAWSHFPAALLNTVGRTTHVGNPEEGDPILEKDPMTERFRGLNEDNPVAKYSEEQMFSWISKVCGDTQ